MKRQVMTAAALGMVPTMAVAQATGVMPGQWNIAVTIDSIAMPGQPAGIADMMKGKTNHIRHCITPAEAARGPQELLKSAKDCTFTRYSMVGGKLTSSMTCKQPGGGTMSAVSSGSFTPTGFTTTGKSVMTGKMPMTMTSTTVGKRLGPCR